MKCLSIHLTDLCNSECTFCVVASPLYARDSVRYADVLAFLRDNAGSDFEIVNLHGGEPTVHPLFIETLQLIRDLGYREVHLQTNGIKLGDRQFTGRVVELGVTKFIVSLHGSTAEIHDGQTYSNGFTSTVNAIENAKSFGSFVRTNTVITNQNLDDLCGIVSLACSVGVDHVNFSNLHPVGSARLSRTRVMPRLDEIRTSLDPAIDLALARGRRVTIEGFPYCAYLGNGRERLHLNNEYRAIRLLMRGAVIDDYDSFMRDDMRTFGKPCEKCSVRELCGGVYPEYLEYYGWGEFRPLSIAAPLIADGRSRT